MEVAVQERFKSLIHAYLKNANCAILTYDITDKSSFTALGIWFSDVKDNIVVEGTFIILFVNKIEKLSKKIMFLSQKLVLVLDRTLMNYLKLFKTIFVQYLLITKKLKIMIEIMLKDF